MSSQPETLLSSRIFDVVRMSYHGADGREHVRDIVMHPGAVAIVPVLESDRIVLIENFRIATGGPLFEIPAGTLEQGETPVDCAARELAEETGYAAGSMRNLTTFYTSPGILREEMHLFLATDLTEGEMNTDPGEEIQVRVTPLADALEMVKDGRIKDAKTIIGLLWYAMERDQ